VRTLALRWAHTQTGHKNIYCGSQYAECEECERAAIEGFEKGEYWLRRQFGCKKHGEEELDDPWMRHCAKIYTHIIRPNRCGDMLEKPAHYLDIAIIGDCVIQERDKRQIEALTGGNG
jgi:hypothetical protein|tara:strand:+ start:198 stop:551 length:354 start_codon:yes stop_codon:yes gene_type:complete